MQRLDWTRLTEAERAAALARPPATASEERIAAVQRILAQVRADGDGALRALTRRFDGVELAALEVDEAAFEAAERALDPALKAAMQEARERLEAWHRAGAPGEFEIETAPGVRCGRVLRAIDTVGLYVPAGSAPLPSTALMLGVPAMIAGCREVVLCTPPRPDGSADPSVLVAARLCGIRRVFTLGGAQAIAAMAFGTESVPRCDKLFGPGNPWVTLAKSAVSALPDGPAIDMPAGPSEVLVVADAGASPPFIAADLLAQAEHGPDSQVLLVTDSPSLAAAVEAEVLAQLARLPREAIATQALAFARLIVVPSLEEAFALSNRYGPEHLIVQVREPRAWLGHITCAGSIFLGDYAPESLGDYCSGTNHVLPTGGAARAWSGVSVASFQRSISVQQVSREGLAAIGPCAITLARAESLEAHAQAVVQRLEGAA
ncbi:histidinol dehydrogenase [Silanimonas lenta]|uniref:histidinol dehydrogenase n=1 Tax=Silanimonas lenta TaxID=265429 RepID=UPI00040C3938|nr:histidinol dehydrogenase [Silanimonas lenta]